MSIQIPPDSTGKTVEANTPNGTDQRQVVTPGSATSSYTQSYDSDGGALIAGIVNDTPESFNVGEQHRFSLTPEGRLRVASTQSDVTQIWRSTFDDPWGSCDNPFATKGISYV